MGKKIKILDTTLRDGSYAINFQFSISAVESLCLLLETAGVRLIEIGHGMGLGAGNRSSYKSLCSDEEYLNAARCVLKKATYGMFCIPGIAKIDDLKMAADLGMGFVRIGSNVENVGQTGEFIKTAKKLGMFVCANYMKSYASLPSVFAEKVKYSEENGADVIYLVDSAGSMIPQQIESYYEAIRRVSNISLGFHGHNNLGLANSNSIFCAQIGFDIIDASLCGMGRSAGNAITEQIVPTLNLNDIETNINLLKILEASDVVREFFYQGGVTNSLDIVCGVSGFHSSYIGDILKFANKYKVNPLMLIIEYAKIDKVNIDYDILASVAKKLPKKVKTLWKYRTDKYIGNEQKL